MEQPTKKPNIINTARSPEEASNDRLKGFYSKLVNDKQSVHELHGYANEAIQEAKGRSVGRVSLRVLADLDSVTELHAGQTSVEAVIPLEKDNLGVVYLGANEEGRQMDEEHLAAHDRLLDKIAENEPHASPEALLGTYGLQAAIVNPKEAGELADAFAPHYAVFGYDREETERMLADEHNTIAYAEKDGEIVTTAMAEKEVVPIEGYGELRLTEITEASTHPLWRGLGLYKAISGSLVNKLIESNNTDAIYGETNAMAPGALKAAHDNGRKFSRFDGKSLGIANPNFGYLPQHVSVADGVESRPYNDFAVTYVDLKQAGEQHAS